MKTSRYFIFSIIVSLTLSTLALGQAGGAGSKRFADGGVTFNYPNAWTLSDKSTETNQHLVLELKGTSAQIMVLVERNASTQPGQRGSALTARTTGFADLMTKELEKVGATVQRSEVTTEVSGLQADGIRLRANPGGSPGLVEVYSFVLGGRIVMITYLRPDTDAAAAAPAWGMVRGSLRVGASVATRNPPDVTGATVVNEPVRLTANDYGKVTGSSYVNNFFGFRLTIPFGWRVQGEEVKDMISEKGREAIQTNDARRNAQLNASVQKTANLLTVFKFQVGAEVGYNASLICGAEWLPNPNISSTQYMTSAKRILSSSQVQYSFQPITTETVGGETFAVMEVESASSIKQKYYASIKRGYALFFILTYATDEDEAILRQALRSVRFA